VDPPPESKSGRGQAPAADGDDYGEGGVYPGEIGGTNLDFAHYSSQN
jgi:hypothetical protein